MKIFLSYSSDARSTAETLCCTLQAAGHEVLFDQEDLTAAQGFNQRIRNAVAAADLFIFLVTPTAVSARHYTLTEIELAARKWPNPAGRVLPVMVTETPFEDLPA
ncbi:MAG: toll/interleukin-1 receptor domain-containing protein, partial [Zoogloeaceae bacterium]|nr:toll/interleukin-1 receptor domain-containing protein [Zoogloeaceae bacterium]